MNYLVPVALKLSSVSARDIRVISSLRIASEKRVRGQGGLFSLAKHFSYCQNLTAVLIRFHFTIYYNIRTKILFYFFRAAKTKSLQISYAEEKPKRRLRFFYFIF